MSNGPPPGAPVSPDLLCNVLDPAVASCFAERDQQVLSLFLPPSFPLALPLSLSSSQQVPSPLPPSLPLSFSPSLPPFLPPSPLPLSISRPQSLALLCLCLCLCLCLTLAPRPLSLSPLSLSPFVSPLSLSLFLPPSLPRSLSPVPPTDPFPLPSPTLPPSLTRCDERTHTHTPLKMQNRLPKVSAAGGPGPDRQRRSFAPLTPPRANRPSRRRELTPVVRRPTG